MRSSAKLVAAVLVFFTPLFIVDLPYISQRAVASSRCSQPIVTDVHLRAPGSALNATIDGKIVTIANSALEFWSFDHGREIVYSGTDGAGGFENEGQSLHIYEAKKRTQRKVLSEYYMINNVQEIKTRAGKTALLVVMQNGGLGMSYLAVVAPDRGEVFRASGASLIDLKGDLLVVGFFKDDDWERIRDGRKVLPYKTQKYDLNDLLIRRLIINQWSDVSGKAL